MTWQLASFVLVIVALAGALAWYELARPSGRLIAVVATLAALAALGRDAFAAVPDVKPITAIVLVSGVAFGAGPGFAVGAISGFASNILLGEGPWTPWQMLGWGLVGLIGAALGALSSRRVPTLALALACAACAEVFNLLLNLYTWSGTGEHTLAAFGLVLGSSVVFDVTHVVASFGFALAFGSVLLRMLLRVRARLEVTWEPAAETPPRAAPPAVSGAAALALALVLAGLALAGGPASANAAPGSPSAAAARAAMTRELAYLAAAQNSDGGFGGGRGQNTSELYSAWVAVGFAAAGRDPLSVRHAGHDVLDALRGEAGELHSAADLERTILALYACGVSVHSLPGGDPVARLLRTRSADGSFAHMSNVTAFAIIALRAAGYAPGATDVRGAARWLAAQQNSDGGYGFGARGGPSDIDDTAAVMQALADAHAAHATLTRATAFLARSQNLDGGYPQLPHGLSNAQSTSWAIQALVSVGRDPASVRRGAGRSPLAYLLSLVAPDGSVRYSRTGVQSPVWVTAQALTALSGKPFPIPPPPRARRANASPSSSTPRPAPVTTAGPARGSSAASRSARPASRAPGSASARGSLVVIVGALGALARATLGQMPW